MLTSLLAATVAVSTLTAQAGRIPADCNRACLEALVNQYLDAAVAHDPGRLPLAADVKYTENEQVLDVGDGFWTTAPARGSPAQRVAPAADRNRQRLFHRRAEERRQG